MVRTTIYGFFCKFWLGLENKLQKVYKHRYFLLVYIHNKPFNTSINLISNLSYLSQRLQIKSNA